QDGDIVAAGGRRGADLRGRPPRRVTAAGRAGTARGASMNARSTFVRGGAVAAALACIASLLAGGVRPAAATAPGKAATPRRGGSVTWGLEAETTGGYCLPSAQLAVSGIMVVNAIYD